jgi:hypothetical protein
MRPSAQGLRLAHCKGFKPASVLAKAAPGTQLSNPSGRIPLCVALRDVVKTCTLSESQDPSLVCRSASGRCPLCATLARLFPVAAAGWRIDVSSPKTGLSSALSCQMLQVFGAGIL